MEYFWTTVFSWAVSFRKNSVQIEEVSAHYE